MSQPPPTFPEVEEILVTQDQIAAEIQRLAERLLSDYEDKDLVLVAVLNGSIVFLADLIRKLPLRLSFDVISASSYSGTASSGAITVEKDLSLDVRGKDVVLLDDIFDTGLTLSFLMDYLREQQPRSLKSCVLLYKKKPDRKTAIEPDYWCLEVADEFVIGYGLDYDSRYRNLPYIASLKKVAHPAS